MSDKPTIPAPQYTLIETLSICFALAQRAIAEVRALARQPGPQGPPGPPVGFDDLDIVYDGERTFQFKFARGDKVKVWDFVIPCMIYRGVWREGAHKRGDAVTHGGSVWIAGKDTDAKPDTAASDWQLAVKRGRDGKDGKGERGAPGPRGERGEQGQRGFAG